MLCCAMPCLVVAVVGACIVVNGSSSSISSASGSSGRNGIRER
jgi:hypothetical protein